MWVVFQAYKKTIHRRFCAASRLTSATHTTNKNFAMFLIGSSSSRLKWWKKLIFFMYSLPFSEHFLVFFFCCCSRRGKVFCYAANASDKMKRWDVNFFIETEASRRMESLYGLKIFLVTFEGKFVDLWHW